jgi:hypothetical protein
MRLELPASLVAAGASNDPIGTHTSKTMMLPELRLLLAAAPGPVPLREYARAAVEDNALRKSTTATRKKTLSMLRQVGRIRCRGLGARLRGSVRVLAAVGRRTSSGRVAAGAGSRRMSIPTAWFRRQSVRDEPRSRNGRSHGRAPRKRSSRGSEWQWGYSQECSRSAMTGGDRRHSADARHSP